MFIEKTLRKQSKGFGEEKKNKEILLNEMCGICFEMLDTEDKCIYLRDCKHMYHMKCINQWRKHNNTCPSCRQSIDVPPFTI